MLNDDEVLAHFRLNGVSIAQKWTDSTRTSFLTIARMVHEAGWDWWWIRKERNPQLRFGRLNPDAERGLVAGQITNPFSDSADFSFRRVATGSFVRSWATNGIQNKRFHLKDGVPKDLKHGIESVVPARTVDNARIQILRLPRWPDQYETVSDNLPVLQTFIETTLDEATEGAQYTAELNRLSRNKDLVYAAKQKWPPICMACDFNFEEHYGDIGSGYIECHHVDPISGREGRGEITSINELKLVCANCHRMIHRRTPCWTVEEMQQRINKHR